MPIKNLSNIRRLPRLGKIALGIKKVSDKSGKEYPSEVDYFVCPPKVQRVFGEKPKELRIMFPVEDADIFFQQWYKSYGFNLLKCKGDGDKAFTWDEEHGGLKEVVCPCEKLEAGECKKIGILQFLLPDVPGAGVWQVTTSSRNSIIDINSAIDAIRAMCGRIRMIPLVLRRVETAKQRIGDDGKPKKSTHYTLQIDVENITIRQLQEAAQIAPERILLPPPDEVKDELLYPANGFEPKEEESESEVSDDIQEAKERLDELMNEYVKAGGEISVETAEKVAKFTKFEEYSAEIDRLQAKLDKKKSPKKKSALRAPSDLFEEGNV